MTKYSFNRPLKPSLRSRYRALAVSEFGEKPDPRHCTLGLFHLKILKRKYYASDSFLQVPCLCI